MSRRPRVLKRGLLKIGLVCGSLLLALGLVELAARVYVAFRPVPPASNFHFRLSGPPPYSGADYFSREFIKESFAQPGGWKTDPSFGWIPNDYRGKYFNVEGGRRKTSDSPDPSKVKARLFLFGGSTVYCSEVPDALTSPSCLQRLLNETGRSLKVENLGATTITLKQQLARLKMEDIRSGDVVVFYNGVNDILQSVFYNNPNGNIIDESRRLLQGLPPIQRVMFKIHRRLSPYSAFVAAFLNPLKAEPNPANIATEVVEAAGRVFLESILAARDDCQGKGAVFIHILQPNLSVATSKSAYEKALLANPWLTPPGLEAAFVSGYPALRAACLQAVERGVTSIDLSLCLEKRNTEVYLDFCHVNHRANEQIATALLQAIRDRL